MILAVVSTHPQPFPRAIHLTAQLARLCGEELQVQHGRTAPFALTGIDVHWQQWYDTRAELGEAMRAASIVVIHGGSGCIFQALRLGVRPVAVPRLARYREHVDDHQLQLCTKLAVAGTIVTWNDGETAAEVLDRLEERAPARPLPERVDLRPAVWAAAHSLART